MAEDNSNTIRVWLRFYGQLNDLLPADKRRITFKRTLPETTSVKDLIEGCGVPHTEVDLVLVDSQPSGLKRLVQTDKSEILDQLEPLTKRYYNNFARCTDCGQVY